MIGIFAHCSPVVCDDTFPQSAQLIPHLGAELLSTLSQTSPCCYVSAGLLKTLWEKKKMLIHVTSNFSISQCFLTLKELSAIYMKLNVFVSVCKLFHLRRVQNLLYGKGLWHSESRCCLLKPWALNGIFLTR